MPALITVSLVQMVIYSIHPSGIKKFIRGEGTSIDGGMFRFEISTSWNSASNYLAVVHHIRANCTGIADVRRLFFHQAVTSFHPA